MPTTDTTHTDIATTSVQIASTSSMIGVMTFAQHGTLRKTAKQWVGGTPTITASSTVVAIGLLTITATGTDRRRIAAAPVRILAGITPQKPFLRIAITPASLAAITQLTDSATRVPATNHRRRATPYRTVTMTSAIARATITASRCRSWATALWVRTRPSPAKPVNLSAVFTPIALATI